LKKYLRSAAEICVSIFWKRKIKEKKDKKDPAMYSADCIGGFILNVLSENENTKESYR
jgi:hypothetical protein